ncbi:hypothetical protein [Methanolobus bombayensis]|uniref:hypothetical protein n=1 Tax=Methanolobus bombayensis TaxID=38023 RepID=UPI001AE2FD73|nr:hypothetical protein [Methanolobus bombayensis]MBP1910253.1 putative nucleic acid-binding Zn-ribbon protein [Methanolobus bombayensis]
MDEEICVLETCDPGNIDHGVSQNGSRDYAMEDAEAHVDKITDGELNESSDIDDEMEASEGTMDDYSVISETSEQAISDTEKSLMIIDDDPDVVAKGEKGRGDLNGSDINDDNSALQEELFLRIKDAETRYSELETRLFMFEEKFNDLHTKMTESLDSSENQLSSVQNDLSSKAHDSDFQELKKDFDQFSKRLRRVAEAEDSVNAESLDPTKVPPDVLEITYAKTLNDLYFAMIEIYGDRESCDMVEAARDSVREFSAGVDFFRFENEIFAVRGLSDAISSKIVSVKQIHGTYVELFKMLYQHVPNYNSQDFRSFVETGSREYTIEKVVSHEEHLEEVYSTLQGHGDELANLTENVSFIAELQNNQLEDIASNNQQLEDIKEQMKSIAKAVNLHTKAISKLNQTLVEIKDTSYASSSEASDQRNIDETITESSIAETQNADAHDMAKLEEIVTSKASKEEIMLIASEMESFKTMVGGMFNSLQEQLQIHIPANDESVQTSESDLDAQDAEGSSPRPVEEDALSLEETTEANADISTEPLNLEDFAPDEDNLFSETEDVPVNFESVEPEFAEVAPEEIPDDHESDLESLSLNPEVTVNGPELIEESGMQVETSDHSPQPLNLEDFTPDEDSLNLDSESVPVNFESVETDGVGPTLEEFPIDTESADMNSEISVDDPEVLEFSSIQEDISEVAPGEPLNFEEFAPDEDTLLQDSENVSVDFESAEPESVDLTYEELPLDLEPDDISSEVVPGEALNLEDFAPDETTLLQDSEDVPVNFESVDYEPVNNESDAAEIITEEQTLDPDSVTIDSMAVPDGSVEIQLSGSELDEPYISGQPQPIRLIDMPIEEVIIGQLSIAGSATMKQLEKQIKENGYPIDFEKLSLVMGYLEQEKLVSATKKGRYTFYSVTGTLNV